MTKKTDMTDYAQTEQFRTLILQRLKAMDITDFTDETLNKMMILVAHMLLETENDTEEVKTEIILSCLMAAWYNLVVNFKVPVEKLL